MLERYEVVNDNSIEITFRRLRDKKIRAFSANIRRAKYTNRITFTGGLMIGDVLRPRLSAEIIRMADLVVKRSSVQEFPDFELNEDGMTLRGCTILGSREGNEYQQFMVRLTCVEGHMYSIFAQGLIEEESKVRSADSILELVREKIVEPVNRLSSVFDGYDKDTTVAIIPAYFSVLRRLMNSRLEKLEAALRVPKTIRLENLSNDQVEPISTLDSAMEELPRKASSGS